MLRIPSGAMERLWGRPQELERGVDPRELQAAGAGLCDSGQVSELQTPEDRDKVGVVDALEPVAFIQVGRLLGHPDRGRYPDRAGDAFANLISERLLDRQANAPGTHADQVRRTGEVQRRFVDGHAQDVRGVPLDDL